MNLIYRCLELISQLIATQVGIQADIAAIKVALANLSGGGSGVSNVTAGAGDPNNVVVGGSPYLIYIDTVSGDTYKFVGTAGATSPWII